MHPAAAASVCLFVWARGASAQAPVTQEHLEAVAATQKLVATYRQCCSTLASNARSAPTPCAEVDPYFAYRELAKDVLAPVRKSLTPRQQSRLMDALSTILAQTARAGGSAFCAAAPTLGEARPHLRGLEVPCTLLEPGQDVPSTFSFVWRRRGRELQVADLLLEGGSLVADYQSQVGRIRQKEGNSGLLRRLEGRAQAANATAPGTKADTSGPASLPSDAP